MSPRTSAWDACEKPRKSRNSLVVGRAQPSSMLATVERFAFSNWDFLLNSFDGRLWESKRLKSRRREAVCQEAEAL